MSQVKIIIFVLTVLISASSSFGVMAKVKDFEEESISKRERQIGIYGGHAFGQKINNAHGNHGALFGQNNETSIEGIVIDQNWAVGINARYFFSNYWGIVVDAMYSQAAFPDQNVSLDGFLINQPKSDLDFITLSIGPIVRYKGDDIWQFLNPYASIQILALLGSASDVNLSPVYGKGGSSNLTGFGGNFRIGTGYEFYSFGVSLEYRFEYLNLDVDHFRSFAEGINCKKSGSYVMISSYYHF